MAYARTAHDTRDLIAPAAPRGFARMFAAVTAAFGAAYDVIDEATDQSAAARNRYPSAD
jgi:hypothetical protein